MKKVLLLSIFVLVMFACTPMPVEPAEAVATSSAIQVPEALKLAIGALILAAVTLGLQVAFDAVGLDLRGVGAAVAVAVTGFAIGQLQGWIDLVPAQYDQLLTITLNVLVVILGGLGTLRAVFHRERASQLLAKK